MMSEHGRSHRPGRRTFRPAVDAALERRDLMATLSPGAVFFQRRAMLAERLMLGQRGAVDTFTTAGGGAVTLTDTDGERYRAQLTNGGSINAAPLPDGRIGLVVRGTNPQSELDIVALPTPRAPNSAHTFGLSRGLRDGTLDVGLIDIYGPIAGVFGYNTADLSGTLIIRDTSTVSRIALAELSPGASIVTGGTVDQLEVLRSAHLAGDGTGITIGQDLNVLNVGEFLTISDGANVQVGRDLGLIAQAASGTGRGGRGARVDGGVYIGPGSSFGIGRNLAAQFLVLGDFVGRSRFQAANTSPGASVLVFGNTVA